MMKIMILIMLLLMWSCFRGAMRRACCLMIKMCRRENNNEFVLQLPAEDEVLLQKLREESRAVFLQRKSRELLDNEELQVKHTHLKAVRHNIMTYTSALKKTTVYVCYLVSIHFVVFLRSHLSFCRICGFCWISTRCLR